MTKLNLQMFGGRGSSGGGGGGGSSNQANEQNYTITKEGKTYFARRADGYAVASGSDRQELENKLQTKMQREGAAFGMKSGETRNLTPPEHEQRSLQPSCEHRSNRLNNHYKRWNRFDKGSTLCLGRESQVRFWWSAFWQQ